MKKGQIKKPVGTSPRVVFGPAMGVPYGDIHPTMPMAFQDRLLNLCDHLNVSRWDREKVYNQLHQMSNQLQNPPRD